MTDWPRPTRDSEPEIIPPGAGPRAQARIWVFEGGRGPGYRHLRPLRPSPLALILLGMALGAGVLLALVALLGAVLFWLPLFGLIALVAIVSPLLRGSPRRRYW
jgi:hypothetical protein